MERLTLTARAGYKASEAVIHMARYLLALPYCKKDARVLDAACGEGYGSWFMKQAGAFRVDGIDLSSKAISTARKLFDEDDLAFHRLDAEEIARKFSENTFDLVVSIETLEHLKNPERFLAALKKVAKRNATIIITCPNDHWYYPTDDQANPHHVRKFTFREFREMTADILGGDAAWGFGVPVMGFGNVEEDLAGWGYSNRQIQMLEGTMQECALLVPPDHSDRPDLRNCSYFYGIWNGGSHEQASSAVYPMSMDRYARLLAWENMAGSPADLETLKKTCDRLETTREELARQLREERTSSEARVAALEAERARLAARLHEKEREAEAHRVRALALEKEQQAALKQIEALRAGVENELAKAATERETLERRMREALTRLHEKEREAEAHRVRALALEKECQVMREHVVPIHRDSLMAHPVQPAPQSGRPMAPPAGRDRLLRMALRIRPFVPGPAWRFMKWLAYRLKILP